MPFRVFLVGSVGGGGENVNSYVECCVIVVISKASLLCEI